MLNFGPFYKNHEITFHNNGNGVHLIRGGNGQGKTSIQRAVLWSLYGKVFDRKGDMIRLTSLLNLRARREDKYKFTVQIHFIHECLDWRVVRTTHAKRHSERAYKDKMKLEVYRDGRIIPDPEHALQRILPSTISRFYFFDGEMLRDYEELLDEDSSSLALLKESIECVLGVPHLKTAWNDLNIVKRKFDNERTRIIRQIGGADLSELADEKQALEKRLDDIENTITNLENQKRSLDTEIATDKRKLADMKEVQELATERLMIEQRIETLEAKKEIISGKQHKLVEKLYINILSPLAKNLIQQLSIKKEKSMEKYDKKQKAIQRADSLKEGIKDSVCSYCETTLDKEALNKFKRELVETERLIDDLTQIPEPDLTYEKSINLLNKMVESPVAPKDFRVFEQKMNELEYNIQSLQAKLNRIRSKLTDDASEEASNLERRIQRNERESGRLKGKVEEKNEMRLKLLNEIGDIERQIAAIPEQQLNELNKRIEFVGNIRDIFKEAVTKFREEQKSKVETEATDIFRQIRSKEQFDRLEINNQYGLNILTRNGMILDRSEWRSSGEEQLVALSLIGALNKCAQVEAPIFMDTPFGRLDIEHGEKVLKFIPKMSKQLVLLVTDREFREGDEIFLEGNIKTDLSVLYKGEEYGSIIITTTSGG